MLIINMFLVYVSYNVGMAELQTTMKFVMIIILKMVMVAIENVKLSLIGYAIPKLTKRVNATN